MLLESAACGTPMIAAHIPKCTETFDEGISGILYNPGIRKSLIAAIRRFIELPDRENARMSLVGREKQRANLTKKLFLRDN